MVSVPSEHGKESFFSFGLPKVLSLGASLYLKKFMKEIVVVEDNTEIREVIEFVLQSDHYSVRLFENIKSFRQYLQDNQPAVIVLDIMLPDGNGLEECRTLKGHRSTKNIPVVLMSANTIRNTIEAGAATFISKPFDITDFKQKVEQYVDFA